MENKNIRKFIYIKENGKTVKQVNNSKEKIIKVLQNKNYNVLSFIPSEYLTGSVDYISTDFNEMLDYIIREHNNTHKKNKKDIYESVITSLFDTVLKLTSKEEVIDLDNPNSFANKLCDTYKAAFHINTAENYIKRLESSYELVNDEEHLLLSYGKVIKQIVRRYITDRVEELAPTQMNKITSEPTPEVILSLLKFKGEELSKHINDEKLKEFIVVLTKYIVDGIKKNKATRDSLCGDCPLEISMKCPRIMDAEPIYRYRFITDGIETTEERVSYYYKDEEGYSKKIQKEDLKNYSKEQIEEQIEEQSKTYKVYKCERLFRYQEAKKLQRQQPQQNQ